MNFKHDKLFFQFAKKTWQKTYVFLKLKKQNKSFFGKL